VEMRLGDAAAAFERADVIVEREFETAMAHQGYIEPHCGTAHWNLDGRLTVWTSTQGAFGVRTQLAEALQLPVSRIRVVPLEIGGGFGGKLSIYLEPIAALLSRKTGRPVQMTMSRAEVFEASGPTSATTSRVRIGAKRDGTLVAGEAHLVYEAGAYPGAPVAGGARCAFAPYDLPDQTVEGYEVVVNKPKVAAYRAPGAPQAEFAVESVIDELASVLGMDPMELRLKNAAKQGTRRPDGAVHGVIGDVDVMQAAARSPHYQSELAPSTNPRRLRGRGVAMGFWQNAGNESSAYANVQEDGTVLLVIGSVDIGGQRASQAMQLAQTLGIPYEDVHPLVTDTDSVGYTANTGGSRTTFATGWATHEAAMDLRRQLVERAAQIWEVDAAAVTYGEDGVLRGPGDRAFTFREIAKQLSRTGGMISGRADITPATVRGAVGASFAAHIVDVEVDRDTGKVEVLRYTAVQDVGTAVHPSYVEGQIQGGAAQGVGMALNEEYVFNAGGAMTNASYLDYRMPVANDLPMLETVLVEVANPGHPFGVRGVGEVPIVPPLGAVANALSAALGTRVTRLPATPGAILEALAALDG
jgi:xanthine dehydrogenase molybdenum-binding subunit